LDPILLTLLVVQAFGAAAVGLFTNIPLTYVGGLAVGVLAALSTKYVASVSWLSGLPSSLPFIILFVVLVAAPSRWLVDFTVERKAIVSERRRSPLAGRVLGGVAVAVVCLSLPSIVGTRLPVYTSGLSYVIVFLSLALLMKTSGQVSLAQLAFAAVGATSSARLVTDVGVPWVFAVLLGALIAVPVGALLAIPAIRRSGLYLALATFGFAVLLERLVYFTSLMFATSAGSIPAPRPSFATSDRGYYFVVLAFAVAAMLAVSALQRARLGRLLRAMADSPVALNTAGMSVTAIKVIVFCIAAFLAGLGGALAGPVTGAASSTSFNSFGGLLLVVIAAIVPGGQVMAAVGAALALVVIPSYITNADINQYLPVLFGVSGVAVAMSHAGVEAPRWLVAAARRARPRPNGGPLAARMERKRSEVAA
jgi:ABC-type branched-subunit amino acid transport system permease subunit